MIFLDANELIAGEYEYSIYHDRILHITLPNDNSNVPATPPFEFPEHWTHVNTSYGKTINVVTYFISADESTILKLNQ